MRKQKGATLIIALSLLTIITLVAVYTIENSSLQGRMVSSSIISYNAFQDVNNELMSKLRFYDDADNYSDLLELEVENTVHSITTVSSPANTALVNSLIYTGEKVVCEGSEIHEGAGISCPIFEMTSIGNLRSSISNQSLGLKAQRLEVEGTVTKENSGFN